MIQTAFECGTLTLHINCHSLRENLLYHENRAIIHYLDDKHTATIHTASIVGPAPYLKVYRKQAKGKMRDI